MTINYAKGSPIDRTGNPIQGVASPVIALATTVSVTNISSVITFNNNSTEIEVAAPNTAVAIKWIGVGATQTSVIASSLGTSNFDNVVPAANFRKFVIPRETAGIAGPALANSVFGLYQRLAVVPINGGVASVLVTEY